MAGRHLAIAAPHPRRTRLLVAGLVIAAMLVAGAAVGLWPHRSHPTPAAAVDPRPSESLEGRDPGRAVEHPSRGGDRGARPPKASPSPSEPPPSESEPAPDAVPDGGEVVATGSCGASFYWEPQPTASGEVFDPEAMTAAHKSWDFDTRVRVTNQANGRSVVVRINDRGPYIDGRCLDLARGAFRKIASLDTGVVTVTYGVLSD